MFLSANRYPPRRNMRRQPQRGVATSGARRAAHEHPGAVAAVDLRVHEPQQHHAAIEGDDLAVLLTGGVARRADIVLAGGAALDAQLLQLGRVGEIHHDATGRTLADRERLLALAAGVGLDPCAVLRLVERRVAPAADDLARPDAGR